MDLYDNVTTDEAAASLAGCLRGNTRLEALGLGDSSAVTEERWKHFSKLLCDTSSPSAIYASNHTLRSLGDSRIPDKLDELLLLNSRRDARDAAWEKVLRYRFKNSVANVREFADMRPEVLPDALSWAGRNEGGRTLMYTLVRNTVLS